VGSRTLLVENEWQEGSVATDLLSVHDGAVIVRGFFGSFVFCWSASRISEGCYNGGLLGAGILDVERKSSV
jgi:hypothetical protein